ncbi:MAG: hypothetical protein NUW37_18945 [Planctomycetes bacterium]|nr:hypothetical protein [Planctomycetota bacterium]
MKSILRSLVAICAVILVYVALSRFVYAGSARTEFELRGLSLNPTFVVGAPGWKNSKDYESCWTARFDPEPPEVAVDPEPGIDVDPPKPVKPLDVQAREFIESRVAVESVMLCSNPSESAAWLRVCPWLDDGATIPPVQRWNPRIVFPGDFVWTPNPSREDDSPLAGRVLSIGAREVVIQIAFPDPSGDRIFEVLAQVRTLTVVTPAARTMFTSGERRTSSLPDRTNEFIPAGWNGVDTVDIYNDGSVFVVGSAGRNQFETGVESSLLDVEFSVYVDPASRRTAGIIAEKISDDSVARTYGFRSRDVIVSVNGSVVTSIPHARDVVRRLADAGTRDWTIEYIRNGERGSKVFHVR